MDKIQIGIVLLWLACAAGLVVLQGQRGLIGVGIILSIIMALGIFPGRHRPVDRPVDRPIFTGADEVGEPFTDADRARAKEVPSGMDDDLAPGPRVLARGTVTVRLRNGKTVTARTRKVEQ